MNWVVAGQSLSSYMGHSFEYARAVRSHLVGLGQPAAGLAGVRASRRVIEALDAVPCLRYGLDHDFAGRLYPILPPSLRQIMPREWNYFRHRHGLYRDLVEVESKLALRRDTIVLFHTIRHNHVLPIVKWAERLRGRGCPRFALLLRFTAYPRPPPALSPGPGTTARGRSSTRSSTASSGVRSMARAIGFLASELQSPNPRGVTRVARAYAEQLAAGDEFELVCLVHPVPQQADVTYLACDLREWLRANPIRQVLPRRPLWRRAASRLAYVCLSEVMRAAMHRALRACRTLVGRLRAQRGGHGHQELQPLALRELDVLAVFDPFSAIYHRPIENEPLCVAGWFHDAIPLRIREGTYWDPDGYSAAVSRLTCKATKIICGSASAERDLHAFFPRSIGRTVTILDGHDHARFRRGACGEDRAGVLAKYVRDRATPYFIVVGAIEPRKNTVNILRACRHLRENSQQDFQLVLVGETGTSYEDGGTLGGLFRTVKVVRTGYVSDAELPILTSAACALLYPSLWEGFGIPPLEAVSAGTLAIASDLASLPEVLGAHAIYCDPYDSRSIAAAMQQCLQMPPGERQRRIEAGVAHASRLTWDVAAAKFAALLGEYFSSAGGGGKAADVPRADRGVDGSRSRVPPGLVLARRDRSVLKAA